MPPTTKVKKMNFKVVKKAPEKAPSKKVFKVVKKAEKAPPTFEKFWLDWVNAGNDEDYYNEGRPRGTERAAARRDAKKEWKKKYGKEPTKAPVKKEPVKKAPPKKTKPDGFDRWDYDAQDLYEKHKGKMPKSHGGKKLYYHDEFDTDGSMTLSSRKTKNYDIPTYVREADGYAVGTSRWRDYSWDG